MAFTLSKPKPRRVRSPAVRGKIYDTKIECLRIASQTTALLSTHELRGRGPEWPMLEQVHEMGVELGVRQMSPMSKLKPICSNTLNVSAYRLFPFNR